MEAIWGQFGGSIRVNSGQFESIRVNIVFLTVLMYAFFGVKCINRKPGGSIQPQPPQAFIILKGRNEGGWGMGGDFALVKFGSQLVVQSPVVWQSFLFVELYFLTSVKVSRCCPRLLLTRSPQSDIERRREKHRDDT